jgi:hypothetical protein
MWEPRWEHRQPASTQYVHHATAGQPHTAHGRHNTAQQFFILPTGRRLTHPYNPNNTPSASVPTYTHLSFLYKRRVPYFNTFQS